MTRRFREALNEQKKRTESYNPRITGTLGMVVGGKPVVEVPNRPSYVYVRVRNSNAEIIQAFNAAVAPVYGLPVILIWQGNRYVVLERDGMRYSNWQDSSAYLPRHASTHEYRGSAGDVVFISQEQVLPLIPMPSGALGCDAIQIGSYNLMETTGTFLYSPWQMTPNLTVWNPTSPTGAVMVLISLDAQSGGLTYQVGSGSVFGNWLTGSADVLPNVPANPDISRYIPIAGVRLITGTSSIVWDNLYDLRPLFQSTRTIAGGGGGGGSTGTVTVTGAYLQLDGTNSPVTGPVRFQNDGSVLGPGASRSPIYILASGTQDFSALTLEEWTDDYALTVDNEGPQGGVLIYNGFYNRPDATSLEVDSNMPAGAQFYNQPDVRFVRYGGDAGSRYYYGAPILLLQNYIDVDDATFAIMDGSSNLLTILNPFHSGTPLPAGYLFPNFAPYHFDTNNELPTGSPVFEVLHNTNLEFWIGPNGEVSAQGWMNIPSGSTYNVAGVPHTHTGTTPGPQGPAGPSGSPGPQGPAGPQGLAGAGNPGMMAWDEGAPLNTGTILNFVGAGVTATSSGSVIDVTIPGGGGLSMLGYVSATGSVYTITGAALQDVPGMAVTFTAPQSGVVFVYANVHVSLTTSTFQVDVGLKDGSGLIEGTNQVFLRTNASIFQERLTYMRSKGGLTPGESYTWKFGSKLAAGAGTFVLQSGMDFYVMG